MKIRKIVTYDKDGINSGETLQVWNGEKWVSVPIVRMAGKDYKPNELDCDYADTEMDSGD